MKNATKNNKKENVNLRSLFLIRNCLRQTRTRSDSTDRSCTSSRIITLYFSAFVPFSRSSSNKTPAVLKTIFDLQNNTRQKGITVTNTFIVKNYYNKDKSLR